MKPKSKKMGLSSVIKKAKDSLKKVTKPKENTETIEVAVKGIKNVKDKNVGCPILGLGVRFYPSDVEKVRQSISEESLEGKITLIEGVRVPFVKVAVTLGDGVVRTYLCKFIKNPTLDSGVDNSWG